METDCPFLAPVPRRGKRNEPAFVASVAARVAELRGVELERVAAHQHSQRAPFVRPSLTAKNLAWKGHLRYVRCCIGLVMERLAVSADPEASIPFRCTCRRQLI